MCYEAQFLARVWLRVDGLHKVFAVLAQAYFFFVDIQFLYVEYNLLLKAVGVWGDSKLVYSGFDALFYSLYAACLKFFNLCYE